jgi:hypothetical protein
MKLLGPLAFLAGAGFLAARLLRLSREARIIASVVASIAIVLGGAGYRWVESHEREMRVSNARVEAQRDLLERVLKRGLAVGDSSETIEPFLKERGISFSRIDHGIMSGYYFSRFTEQDAWIQVTIHTDDALTLQSISVQSCWTSF